MELIKTVNFVVLWLFFICYSYQLLYIPAALLYRPRRRRTEKLNRIAVLIAARNEEAVIGNLLDSIAGQSYPAGFVETFVVADNCTDGTAAVAAAHGANVVERRDPIHVGKGYALNYLLQRITGRFDAYIVLDADNVLDRDFIREINRTYSEGYPIVTCYRNSKNYGDNWISAGYALWFLREARYLNGARMAIGSSCAVSGTGFLFSDEVLRRCGGWNFFLLTEDIQFTIYAVTRGERIGYAANAVLYDEQPVTFKQSWHQRMRWSRGYLQVFGRYGGNLIRGIFRGSFSCYDMTMNIMPAAVLTAVTAVVNVTGAVLMFRTGGTLTELGLSLGQTVLGMCGMVFLLGVITTVTEWKNIFCPAWKKLLYMFTFPVFMLTYIPICIASLFVNPGWKPIRHTRALTPSQILSCRGRIATAASQPRNDI